MRVAMVACLPIAVACGRLGFEERAPGADASISASSRIDVRPRWSVPAGTTITVTLLDASDATGAEVTLDGVPCEAPVIAGATITCDAPAHTPAVVALAVSRDGSDEVAPFSYIAPGIVQLGGPSDDASSGVTIDGAGNTYVVGGTTGDLDGPNVGDFDVVLVKFDAAGRHVWTRQLGSAAYDYARDAAVDPSGDVTVVGYTAGSFGVANAGGNDILVARYRPDGTRRWVTQFGSAGDDQSWDLAVDAAGYTVVALRTTGDLGAPNAGGFDAAITRLDPDGAVQWMRQTGTAVRDIGHSVTVTAAGVAFLVGYTDGALEPGGVNAGAADLFVARFEPDGTPGWLHQRGGAGDDLAQDATIDDTGDLWVVGSTSGVIDGQPAFGAQDVLVTRWSPAGAWRFTRVFGAAGEQYSFGVAVPAGGPVYVSCSANGAFDGQAVAGSTDACLISLERDGQRRWTRMFGSTLYDAGSSCAVSSAFEDLVFVSLITGGSLDGMPNRGINDLGFARYGADGTAY